MSFPKGSGVVKATGGDPTIIRRTFTWSEWTDKANTVGEIEGSSRRSDDWHDKWAGGSFDDAIRMATTDGYHDSIPEAERFSAHVEASVMTDRLATTFASYFDVAGAEVDMGRYLAGEPECMRESEPIRIASQGRAVRIVVPVCYQSNVDEEVVRQRGAAVMALVDVLARAQHPLEVWGCLACTMNGKRLSYMIEVQRANEPLDMGRVMFALAHPTMLRRLGFAVEEHENKTIRNTFNIGHGYGSIPYAARESDLPEIAGTSIVLPELWPNEDWSEAAALTWINQALSQIFGD